jgi:hypothetical protein
MGIVLLLSQVIQNPINGVLVFNAGDNLHSTPATVTNLNIDIEHALQALCPGHRRVALCRCPC